MEGKQFLTTDDLMIDDYITQNDPSMSVFLDVVDKAGFRGMVHAYGTYTCFIPTNDAIAAYLDATGKSSVNQLSVEECEEFVKYHVVMDTLRTVDFIDGRLQTANMVAKYLTTRAREVSGNIFIEVNRQALILEENIRAANGYIHKIDNVLTIPEFTVGEKLMMLPDEYSIVRSIMERTGWVDTLSTVKNDEDWHTVFLQSDETMAKVGINSIDDLIERLRIDRPDILETDSLLWTFAAYHCVKGLYYVADLVFRSAMLSQAPNQALTFKLKRDSLLVNEYVGIDGKITERGIPVNRKSEFTDFTCYNGVLHDLEGYIGPLRRMAQAVYWEVTEQPEFLADSRFRRPGNIIPIPAAGLSGITQNIRSGTSHGEFAYECRSAGYSNDWAITHNDALRVRFNRVYDISLTLPLLNEGTYNVWICYRRANTAQARIRGAFLQEGEEEQIMSNVVLLDHNVWPPRDPQMQIVMGHKRYTAKNRNQSTISQLMGAIVVQSTGRHILRLDVLDEGQGNNMWIDMFHFIPIEQNQLWPRFDFAGNPVWLGTPCDEIQPIIGASCPADNDEW